MAEPGDVSRAMLAVPPDIRDDTALAEHICRAVVAALDIDGAAISLLTASSLRHTLYASNATAELLEDLQFTLGEGACIDAARSGRPVLVPDITDAAETGRWPVYAAAVARQAGVGAVFALPLQWGTINLGVLDLYRWAPGSLDNLQLRDVMSAADTAALMLLELGTGAGGGHDLDRAWSGRAAIHQATGMVSAQLGISVSDAFARLRARAFAESRLLGDVADDVVARRLRFTTDDPPMRSGRTDGEDGNE